MREPATCLIADDDEIDRLTTVSFVRRLSFVKIDGVFGGSKAVQKAVENKLPDILFLDIDMPGLSGLGLRDRLRHIPVCVFITSYPEYAAESFEKEAFDFLIKPIKADRFDMMAKRLQDYLILRDKAATLDTALGSDSIFIKEGHDRIKIRTHEILYLEALKDYTRIVTADKKHCVLSSLGNLLKEDSFKSFIRVHRSYAVQKEYIGKVTASSVMIKDFVVPIGRVYKDILANL
jgi:two-component system, LytTR family, response regulator